MDIQALAQDQLRALHEFSGQEGSRIGMGVYDGDTNQDLRLMLRDSSRLVQLFNMSIVLSQIANIPY